MRQISDSGRRRGLLTGPGFPFRAIILALFVLRAGPVRGAEWSVGTAARSITPSGPTVVVGHSAATVFDNPYCDLFAKATIIGDRTGRRLVIVSADVLDFQDAMADELREGIIRAHLPGSGGKTEILLNASHSHSGPPINTALLDDPEAKFQPEYVEFFRRQLVGVVGDALAAMRPATLRYVEDECDLAINRRVTRDGATSMLPNPDGPVDHRVQVIAARDARSGEDFAWIVKYSCHPVTMANQGIGADFPGFMMRFLGDANPGVGVQFVQGCCGDCRPRMISPDGGRFIPGTLDLVIEFGRSLADGVGRALAKEGTALSGGLSFNSARLDLPVEVPDRDVYESHRAASSAYYRKWAEDHLAILDSGGAIPAHVPLRIHVVRIGMAAGASDPAPTSVALVTYGAEIFNEYGMNPAGAPSGEPVMALGYTNGMAGYVPTAEAIPLGGYEVEAYKVWNKPGRYRPEIESRIRATVRALIRTD